MAVTKGHYLYDLPPEVVEKIVENIDLETIEPSSDQQSVSHTLSWASLQEFFRQKTTDLTESSLRASAL